MNEKHNYGQPAATIIPGEIHDIMHSGTTVVLFFESVEAARSAYNAIEGAHRVAVNIGQLSARAEPVAYLDLGAGGYTDVGTDLTDEQLARLPKGRHMLAIVGTYGVDGYVAASAHVKPDIVDLARDGMEVHARIPNSPEYRVCAEIVRLAGAAPVAAQAPTIKESSIVAQPAVNQSTEREVFRRLLEYAESQICTHEETHRGGAIWEICDQCGAKWADDEGGKPEFAWPKEIADARAALAQQPSARTKDIEDAHWIADHLNGSDPGAGPIEAMHECIDRLATQVQQPSTQDRGSQPNHWGTDVHAALLYVLWHHQGGSSGVGQPIRKMLGLGQHDHMTPEQCDTARRVQSALAVSAQDREDAERYRWLRNESWAGYHIGKGKPQVAETIVFIEREHGNVKTVLAEEALDAAIDAARAAKGE